MSVGYDVHSHLQCSLEQEVARALKAPDSAHVNRAYPPKCPASASPRAHLGGDRAVLKGIL